MALSDEERRRVYEEEMTRARASERIKNRQLKVGCWVMVAIVFAVIIAVAISSSIGKFD